ncbi:DUF4259 domain-containing protein [Nocardioides daphniae]|uniref:DUF4259 domain-containing protein n=1 Tax=Nocardioides daphniae TaxID=402297 RepID=A0A4P7UDH3_9ACTN|nr:DUF4259 domain-containing protein [Nocardioides daphniae]QCC78322.1 DUF4259 domain-containing protein [Nocardioides daphniae]GGD13586.1 hypothetical protein GCM10007231_10780 [Nocardioides daphniae]
MGAWGTDPFDNDDAADWSYELEGAGPEVVAVGLSGDEGDAAIVAAAAVVASACGVPVTLSPEAEQWLVDQDEDDLRALAPAAVAALEGVLQESELRDLWDESGDDTWLRETTALRDGLGSVGVA